MKLNVPDKSVLIIVGVLIAVASSTIAVVTMKGTEISQTKGEDFLCTRDSFTKSIKQSINENLTDVNSVTLKVHGGERMEYDQVRLKIIQDGEVLWENQKKVVAKKGKTPTWKPEVSVNSSETVIIDVSSQVNQNFCWMSSPNNPYKQGKAHRFRTGWLDDTDLWFKLKGSKSII